MKKFTLLLLVAFAGVLTANAADNLYLHNQNDSWGAYPAFTNTGTDNGQDVYEYTLNSSTGLGTGDFYFRLKFADFNDDLRPYGGSDYSLLVNNVTDGYYETYEITHSDGNFWGNNGAWYIPHSTIKASEYKITVYSTYRNKYYLKVEVVSMPATISNLGYSTFSCGYALDLSNVTAYYADNVSNGKVVLKKTTGKVPAATGLLLAGSGTVNIPVVGTSEATAISGNLLHASVTATDITPQSLTSDYYYFLSGTSAETIGFYHLNNGTTYTSGAGKAYLRTNTALANEGSGTRAAWIFQDNEPTAIEGVQQTMGAQQYYDLQGRRVAQPTKGLYIVNGKKIIK